MSQEIVAGLIEFVRDKFGRNFRHMSKAKLNSLPGHVSSYKDYAGIFSSTY